MIEAPNRFDLEAYGSLYNMYSIEVVAAETTKDNVLVYKGLLMPLCPHDMRCF